MTDVNEIHVSGNALVASLTFILAMIFVDCRFEETVKTVRYTACVAHHAPEGCK